MQYLDELDDLFGAAGLVGEKLRRGLFKLIAAVSVAAVAGAGIGLALLHPPIALGTSTVLFVILLYRKVTAPVLKSYA
jgi:hypothetical protein